MARAPIAEAGMTRIDHPLSVHPLTDRAVRLSPVVTGMLGRLRRAIRAYVCLEGFAVLCIFLGLAFWLALAIDWYFEPSVAARMVMAATVFAAAVFVMVRYVAQRLLVPLRYRSLALLVERRYGQFDDSLITAVELAGTAEAEAPLARQLFDRVVRRAASEAGKVRWQSVLNPGPLLRTGSAALLLVGSIALFAVLQQEAFQFWIRRMMFATQPWPRYTRLEVDGFTQAAAGPRIAKVARGDPFLLVVRADAGLATPPPQTVTVRYRRADGLRGRDVMTRIGRAIPGRDPAQVYHYTLQDVTLPVDIDIRGGDDRIDNLRLLVVERPEMIGMVAHCRYPEYLETGPAELSVGGVMEVPEGTNVELRGTSSKELLGVTARSADTDEEIPVALSHSASPRHFTLTVASLVTDQALLLQLEDVDGAGNRQPYRIALRAIRDDPPRIAVTLKGVGTAITPDARIPLTGEVSDDHAVKSVAFEYRINDGPTRSQSLVSQLRSALTFLEIDQAIDLRQLPESDRPEVGHKFHLAVQAADGCGLERGPHKASSPYFLLDVVTPDQLRSLLDRRELLLRRRFETIRTETTETRDLMASLPSGNSAVEPAGRPGGIADRPAPASAASAGGADIGGESVGDSAESNERLNRRLRLLRTMQNIERAAHETMEVAGAFQDIHDEIVNNRMDTPSILERLEHGIVQPLRRIGGESLPALQSRFVQLTETDESEQLPPEAIAEAVRQTDVILVEMQQVLDKMLALESYNEAVQILRGILGDQQHLNLRTRESRKDRLRKLLDEESEPPIEAETSP
jgi:hypothetical protein